jgi:hypothetical protein
VPGVATLALPLEIGDLVVGLLLTATSVWFFLQAMVMPDYSGTAIGAADFPKGLSVLLGIASLGLAGGAIWRMVSGNTAHPSTIRRPMRVFLGIALLVAFPSMMTLMGYYIAMSIFLSAFLYLCDCRNPVHIALYVAGFLVFTKLVFEMLLQTPLP